MESVHESLKAAVYTPDTKGLSNLLIPVSHMLLNIFLAVAFQFACVGNDKNVQEHLEFLDDHSSVNELVDTVTISGSDPMELFGWHGPDLPDGRDLNETQQRNVCYPRV